MLRLLILPLILLLFACPSSAAEAGWPVNFPIDLSSGFGDYRPGHFHFGIDIRTGGVTGKKVIAPVDGWVWRVRTAYEGYGKALYIRGDDGYTYVMAHLQDFATEIDKPLKAAQVKSRRYYQDIYFPKDSIRVEKNRLVAWSGQTGSGAPHLHFEKRKDDFPLNPLRHGYEIEDKTRPRFQRIGFHLRDNHSVFLNGRRKQYFDAVETSQPGRYTLDTALYFDAPVGILAECFDLMRPTGMRRSVYHLALYVDDKLWYESRMDSVDFGTNKAVSLEYEYLEAVDKRKHVRRLYKKAGNDFRGSRGTGSHDGVLGAGGTLDYGAHDIRVVAVDDFGNESQLNFPIIYGPPDYLYKLDTTISVAVDKREFVFSLNEDAKEIDIDSVAVLLNRGTAWGRTPDAAAHFLEDGRLVVRAAGRAVDRVTLRLVAFAANGALILDNVFSGIFDDGSGKVTVEHEIVEDGMLINLDVRARHSSDARVELYYGDSLLGVEYPTFITMSQYVAFIPPQPKYRKITKIQAVMSHDPQRRGFWSDSLKIVAVGFTPSETVAFDDEVFLQFNDDVLFEPMFVELIKNDVINRSLLALNSENYVISPEAFITKSNFIMRYEIPRRTESNRKSGLCWLDEEKNKWVWLDNEFDSTGHVLTAASQGGGSFAAVYDYVAPEIKQLSLRNGAIYQNRRPAVNFVIEDTLSGIGDDRDITIELDGEWLIPEYEPETGRVRSRPLEMLEAGRHHLGLIVRDRAGNVAEQYLQFIVK